MDADDRSISSPPAARREAIAERWYRALAHIVFSPLSAAELRHDLAALWNGLSLYATEAQARATAAAYPRRGWRAVAAVNLPDDGRFHVRKTLGPGHDTVWGAATDLLACVIAYNPR